MLPSRKGIRNLNENQNEPQITINSLTMEFYFLLSQHQDLPEGSNIQNLM